MHLLKGTSQALGLGSMGEAFGDHLHIGLRSDASAAIAISQRIGFGKLRHIQTQFLWLQERVSRKDLALEKVVGATNPADMITKHVSRELLDKHLTFSNYVVSAGRAETSLNIGTVLVRPPHRAPPVPTQYSTA